MTIELDMKVSESYESKSSSEHNFLRAQDRLVEVPLTVKSNQQSKFSATTPAEVQNEPLAQGVGNDLSLSSVGNDYYQQSENSDTNASELKQSSFGDSSGFINSFESTHNVFEVDKHGYIMKERNTSTHEVIEEDKHGNIMKEQNTSTHDGNTDNITAASLTTFDMDNVKNASEMLDGVSYDTDFEEDRQGYIMNERNTDNLTSVTLTMIDMDGIKNASEILGE